MTNYYDKTILFFDGECVLCNKTVQWILKNENYKKDILFCPLNSSFAENFILNELKKIDSVVLYKDKKFYVYFDVFFKIIPHLKWYWKFLYTLQIVPKFLQIKIYQWIAKNRKKWWGTSENCWIMTPEWKGRCIE